MLTRVANLTMLMSRNTVGETPATSIAYGTSMGEHWLLGSTLSPHSGKPLCTREQMERYGARVPHLAEEVPAPYPMGRKTHANA